MAEGKDSANLSDNDDFHHTAIMTMPGYLVGRKIGSGGFAQVRLAKQIQSGEICAVKLEKDYCTNLLHEYNVYKQLGAVKNQPTEYSKHIPRVIEVTKCGPDYEALVMDLMGLSLHDMLFLCSGTFSLKTVLLVAKQILDCVEYVHSKNIIHRDIKTANFVIGRRSVGTDNTIHLIDFGLSEEFRDPISNSHVPFMEKYERRGTFEFMSLSVHKRRRPSRRDDLESILYTLMYLLKGPEVFYVEAGESLLQKKEWLEMTIYEHFPSEFGTYLKYVRSLKFSQTPDYDYLRNLFKNLYDNENYSDQSVFDWTGKNMPEINMSLELRLKRI